jgi:hypothetical protein
MRTCIQHIPDLCVHHRTIIYFAICYWHALLQQALFERARRYSWIGWTSTVCCLCVFTYCMHKLGPGWHLASLTKSWFFEFPDLWPLWKHGLAYSLNISIIMVRFQIILHYIFLVSQKRCHSQRRVIVSVCVCVRVFVFSDSKPTCSEYFENTPLHVFKVATSPGFRRTRI